MTQKLPVHSTVAFTGPEEVRASRSERGHHPLTKLVPEMEARQRAALRADIKKNGLRVPIMLLDDEILDGRARYSICIEIGVTPRFERFVEDDPLSFVISQNLHRRHLAPSQRAMAVARYATMSQGARTDLAQNCARSQSQAADMGGVSRRSLQSAFAVCMNGHPELVRQAADGEIRVSDAAKIARMPLERQAVLVGLDRQRVREALQEAKALKAIPPTVAAACEGVHKFYDNTSAVSADKGFYTGNDGQVGIDSKRDSEIARLREFFDAVVSATGDLAALCNGLEEHGTSHVDVSPHEEIQTLSTNARRLRDEAHLLLGIIEAVLDGNPARAGRGPPDGIPVGDLRQSESAEHLAGIAPLGESVESVKPAYLLNQRGRASMWDGMRIRMDRRNQVYDCIGPRGLRLGMTPSRASLSGHGKPVLGTPPPTASAEYKRARIGMEQCVHEAGHAVAHWYFGIRFGLVTAGEVSGFELPPLREEAIAQEAAGDLDAIPRVRALTEILMCCAYAGPLAQARYSKRCPSPFAGHSRIDVILAFDGGQWDLEFVAECTADWVGEGITMAATAHLLADALIACSPFWRAVREVARRLNDGSTLAYDEVDGIARQNFAADVSPTVDEWLSRWAPSATSILGGYLPNSRGLAARDTTPFLLGDEREDPHTTNLLNTEGVRLNGYAMIRRPLNML